MVFAVAAFCDAAGHERPLESALDLVPPDALATVHLVRTWLGEVRRALTAVHHLLLSRYNLDQMDTDGTQDELGVVQASLIVILGTGPPDEVLTPAAISRMLGLCVSTQRFFLGSPSQHRGGVPAS